MATGDRVSKPTEWVNGPEAALDRAWALVSQQDEGWAPLSAAGP